MLLESLVYHPWKDGGEKNNTPWQESGEEVWAAPGLRTVQTHWNGCRLRPKGKEWAVQVDRLGTRALYRWPLEGWVKARWCDFITPTHTGTRAPHLPVFYNRGNYLPSLYFILSFLHRWFCLFSLFFPLEHLRSHSAFLQVHPKPSTLNCRQAFFTIKVEPISLKADREVLMVIC